MIRQKGEEVVGGMLAFHMEKSAKKSSFDIERSNREEECLKLLPRHARFQNMAYSFKLEVDEGLYIKKE